MSDRCTPGAGGSSFRPVYVLAESAPEAFGPSADAAATAAFFEMGDRMGIGGYLQPGKDISAAELSDGASLPEPRVRAYLDALVAAALLEPSPAGSGHYRTAPDFAFQRYGAGYLSWALNANRPFIECACEFFTDPGAARAAHQRDGRQVAVSSEWMGSVGFYPPLLEAIVDARPRRIVDLGAGSGALVIDGRGWLP